MPTSSKDYIHRVGRTARAGRAGKAITIVTQYDVEVFMRLEDALGKKLEEWPTSKEDVALLRERVHKAGSEATSKMREEEGNAKRKRGARKGDDRDRDDDIVQADTRLPKAVKRRRTCKCFPQSLIPSLMRFAESHAAILPRRISY